MAFTLSSPAFRPGASVPERCLRAGADLSPPLVWSGAPPATQSFALWVNDPDVAGGFAHWLLFNLSPTIRALPEGLPKALHLSTPVTAKQGRNDYGAVGWGGPQPPPGERHRYSFRLFALDARLPLSAGADAAALGLALAPHTLAVAELTGLYP